MSQAEADWQSSVDAMVTAISDSVYNAFTPYPGVTSLISVAVGGEAPVAVAKQGKYVEENGVFTVSVAIFTASFVALAVLNDVNDYNPHGQAEDGVISVDVVSRDALIGLRTEIDGHSNLGRRGEAPQGLLSRRSIVKARYAGLPDELAIPVSTIPAEVAAGLYNSLLADLRRSH